MFLCLLLPEFLGKEVASKKKKKFLLESITEVRRKGKEQIKVRKEGLAGNTWLYNNISSCNNMQEYLNSSGERRGSNHTILGELLHIV